MRDFPIPVVALGAGSQVEEEALDYLPMPNEMAIYQPPRMPEYGDPAARAEARAELEALLADMRDWRYGSEPSPVRDLSRLSPAVRALVNDALGDGEVSALLPGDTEIRIQETAFAGVWRVVEVARGGAIVRDVVEVCAAPPAIVERARAAAGHGLQRAAEPDGLMNAPALLSELVDASARHRPGAPAHIINLTLLPLVPADLEHLVASLGPGGATLLSRGYGNCRITASGLAHTWWVQYFNSSDKLILDTIEVVDIPEVALAASEDIADSTVRLAELLPLI